jgi:nucleoside-diphosphate-sugar epimerase
MTTKVLLTGTSSISPNWTIGATGFIGGQLLHDILPLKSYDVTALVRDTPRAELLKSHAGVKVIIADLDSSNLADIAAQFDVILHTAHSDHVLGADALLAGLEKRAATAARKPLLIHTSGTGVLIDFEEADGNIKSKKIYSDDDLRSYRALPATQPHKNVDNVVLAAGRRGKVDTVIVCPPTIWGTGQGEFNTHSIQVPGLIRACVKYGTGLVVNDGANTWSIIHVADLSQAYLTILDAGLHGKLPSDPDGRYFFVEHEEYQQRQVAERVATALYERGKAGSPETKTVSYEEAGKYHDGPPEEWHVVQMTGSNSRSRAVLLRKLGWEAKKGGNKEFFESIKDDVDYILSHP